MGFEGSMSADCPDTKMTTEQSDQVYAGNVDFRKNEGWVNKLSPMGQSIVTSKIYEMLLQRENCPTSDASIILAVGTTKEEYNKIKNQCVKHLYEK